MLVGRKNKLEVKNAKSGGGDAKWGISIEGKVRNVGSMC